MESVKKWLSERNTRKNGLYIHYTPPKLIGVVSSAQLRRLARDGSQSRVERAVLAGQGWRLLAESEALAHCHQLPALIAKCDSLHAAVEKGSLMDLQDILESDYNRRKIVNCRDEAGVGLLHKAVYYDYMDIAEYLVKEYPQLVHAKDSEGRTPLHYAGVCRDAAGAAALLEGAGAARGARDAAGRTPAHYRGDARTLLTLPVPDRHMPKENKRNPPGLVIKRHNIRIWCHDCDMSRLQRVVWEGHGSRLLSEVSNQHVVKKFLEAVPYIMNTIKDIHTVTVDNDLEGLMKHSGDPVPPQALSCRDANFMTVMHKAAGLGYSSIVKYIAERYPQGVNDIDNEGRTPLHYAAAVRDDQHIYNTLVELGADESILDNKNKTPAYYVNRPQEIDKHLLKTIPEAPRTPSSAYPASWDWKLLDNYVINELQKKSRRKNLRASNENISSKNYTNTISESTDNHNGMKASSTHEFISDLPELDDRVKNLDETPEENHEEAKEEPQETEITEEQNTADEANNTEDEGEKEETPGDEENVEENEDKPVEEGEEINNEEGEENTINYADAENEGVPENTAEMENNPEEIENAEDIENAEEANENDETNKKDDNPAVENPDDRNEQTDDALENDANNETTPENDGESTHDDEPGTTDENDPDLDAQTNGHNKDHDVNGVENGEASEHEGDNDARPKSTKSIKSNNTYNGDESAKDLEGDEERNSSRIEGNDLNNENSEDDDDVQVQVQGDTQSEYSEINQKSTAEVSHSGSANIGSVSNGRNTQESLIEGIIKGDAELDSQDASIAQRDESVQGDILVVDSEIDPEVTDLINSANMEMLATLVLNGEGGRLIGRRSRNSELQGFLENVPTYMQKINKVHVAAREGNIKDLQASLDRRKFAIARDPISPNGATPLHVATVFGKSNIMKYLGGRFPETLSAVDFEGRTALHYAAVLPDNGHYYNLLQQLGANSKDLDDNGKAAEDYFKNPSLLPFDQLLSEFGINEDGIKTMFADKVPEDHVSSRRELEATEALDTIERCYRLLASARPTRTPLSASSNRATPPLVLGRFLKKPVFENIKRRITKLDHDLFDVIWPAVKKLPDNRNILQTVEEDFPGGITAPDYYVYEVFHEFLTPLIKDLHNMNVSSEIPVHPPTDFIKTSMMKLDNEPLVELNIDPTDEFVLSGTIECSRNIDGFELPLNLRIGSLETIERIVTTLLTQEEFAKFSEYSNPESDQKGGTYYTLNEVMEKPSQICASLAANGLLIALCEREEIDDCARLHGKHWPYGRGVFVSEDKSVAVWINVHDHIRVLVSTAIDCPGEIGLPFSKLTYIMTYFQEKLDFVWDPKLGHLSSRPTFLGAGIRFSLIVNFPGLSKDTDNMKHLCAMRGLQYRETLSANISRISNYQCLSITETSCFNDFATASSNLLHLEKDLSMQNSTHIANMLTNIFRRKRSSIVDQESPEKRPNQVDNEHMDIPIFRTEEGRYLAQSLGDPLIKGLTEVANVKPKDPVAFLATFLHNFPENEKSRIDTQETNVMLAGEEAEVENEEVPMPVEAQETSRPKRSAARTATRPHRPIDVVTVDPQPVISPDAPETAFSSAKRDEHGQSMLHFAAARTHARNALFQLLQESDVSLAYRDELYRTARDVSTQANVPENTVEIDKWVLHLAARGNAEKIEELLLEGYDHILDIVDEEGVSITDIVAQRGDNKMQNLLASIPAFEESRDILHSAVRRGDLDALKECLEGEKDHNLVNSQNSFSRTALHIAVLAQHEEVVSYLAQTYPELLRIGDNLERTPLHYAMGVEKIESLSRVLIRAGSKRVLKDLKGRQPSYYFMNKSDILRLQEEEDIY